MLPVVRIPSKKKYTYIIYLTRSDYVFYKEYQGQLLLQLGKFQPLSGENHLKFLFYWKVARVYFMWRMNAEA